MKKKAIFYLFFSFLFFCSCFPTTNEFEESIDLKNKWNFNSPASFKFNIKDAKQKTISVLIRNNDDYEFSNIYFFVHHSYPNGKKQIDTLQYFLADNKGKWLGKGFTSTKENLLELKAAKNYPIGNHKIKIFHGMRKKNLIGLEDLSLTIN